jgi:tetratricopeptide (TPR) repeat protein
MRSDVYTLGVVLYELLTGRLPYTPRTDTVHERARAIAEEPALRPGAVDRRLRGDLETIAGKALEKDRERRYQSALELGQDLRRFLRREPIAARPPSAVYQFAMFARRHRGLVAAAVAVLIVLVGGIVTTWRQAARAERQRREAVAARDFLQEVLIQASPLGHGGKEPSMRRVLELALERVDRHLMAEPGAEAGVRHTLGRVQRELGLVADARVQLERAAELYAGPARDDVQLMFVLADLCGALVKLGELDAAERTIQRARALRPALGERHAFILGHAAGSLAVAQYVQGRLAEAEQSCRESLAAYERLADDRRDVNVAEAKGLLALVLQGRGRRDEAERLYRESIAALRAAGARNSVLAITLGNFAGLLGEHGALDEALAARREALAITTEVVGEDHADAAFARKEVGLLLFERGEREVGLQMVRDALALQRSALGEHPRVVQTLVQLAELAAAHGDPAGAETHLRDASGIAQRKLGERHFLTVRARAALGGTLADAGRSEEAIGRLEAALAIARSDFADRAGDIARTGAALARALCGCERFLDAEQQLIAIAGDFDGRDLAADHPARRTVLEALVAVYDAWRRPEEARRVRESLARD